MNLFHRFLDDLKRLNGQTSRNRHDRRKSKATEAVKETRGRYKYGKPRLPPGFWKLWRME